MIIVKEFLFYLADEAHYHFSNNKICKSNNWIDNQLLNPLEKSLPLQVYTWSFFLYSYYSTLAFATVHNHIMIPIQIAT
jgi:hypothetical protein